MCVHVFLKIIEMNKSRTVYNSQFTIVIFPVYIVKLLLGSGLCQYPRKYLTSVCFSVYNNHAFPRIVKMKIFRGFGEKF